ncbi:MAG: hypothetical protein JW892_16790 [Anaerolineae bacterium]|nr:hypothetical protein [Anaerolineae bacterium]
MTEMPALWTAMFNLFNPLVPVSGDYLSAWFVERKLSPLPRMELAMRPNRAEQKVLLAGQRGCGKTSELFCLMSHMQSDYFTVYTDLGASATEDPVSSIELFFAMGAAVYKAARDAGLKPSEGVWKELVSSLSTLTREQTREKGLDFDPLAPLNAIVATASAIYPPLESVSKALSVKASLGLSQRDIEKIEVEPVLREVVTRVNAILADVRCKANRPVLLVADGLDKIKRMETALSLFNHTWAFDSLACQAVYTVPPVLYYSVRFQEIGDYFSHEELPNVRLYPYGQRGKWDPEGLATLHRLVEKRLQAAGLDIPSHVFDSDALALLIQKSGGVMRDLVELIRSAVLSAESRQAKRIEMVAAQEAVALMRRKIQAGFFKGEYEALLDVQKNRGQIDKANEIQMELLRGNLIVNYENGGFWRDLHPLVVDILRDYSGSTLPSE